MAQQWGPSSGQLSEALCSHTLVNQDDNAGPWRVA
jgi:hypothetical protein